MSDVVAAAQEIEELTFTSDGRRVAFALDESIYPRDAVYGVVAEGLDTLVKPGDLHAALTSGGDSMKTRIRSDTGLDEDPAIDDLSNNSLGPIDQTLQDNAGRKADSAGNLPPPPPVGTPLVYEEAVTPVWPPAGAS